jgi:low temperature requirement protein LtrA
MPLSSRRFMRIRDGEEARVTNAELFFDLVYAFAVTQISHYLLGHLTLLGGAQTLLLWFAVWLGWQYTCWVTNWFDPETKTIRLMLFGIMLVGLVMAASLPDAFSHRGLLFAVAYVAMQVGRSAYVLSLLDRANPLRANYLRIFAWTSVSAVFWIAGGIASDEWRLALWAIAVIIEYGAPMAGFHFPFLGRSRSADWTIEGGHLAERCQQFVMVALGESLLVTGDTLSSANHFDAPILIAFLVAFVGAVAMWWLYFDTSSKNASEAIVRSDDPGRVGAYFHYTHVLIVAGIIVCAVAYDLIIAHPDSPMRAAYVAVLTGGPFLYVFGNALYKTAIYGRFPLSHVIGLVALLCLAGLAWLTDALMVGGLSTLIVMLVAGWETRARMRIVNAAP